MNKQIKQITLAAMCVAIGVVLPQAFHFVPNAGSVILPMHIPVLISGFICGPMYGLIVGVLTPILSHLLFSMPPAPILASMVLELAVYGLMTGLLNNVINTKNELVKNYMVLVLSMLAGRVSYGVANALIFKAGQYSMAAWMSAAFIKALPGIVIQLVLIPMLVQATKKMLK